MGKLYIFGNGLDLHYRLKTRPDDFLQILRNKQIYNEASNAAEIFENYNVLWNNFEQDMAYLDLEQIEENQVQSPESELSSDDKWLFDDGDYYMERQPYLINAFYESLKKNMQTEKLRSFLMNAGNIDEVLVYGHSLGDVDVPYLELIDSILQPRMWKVSYYRDNDEVFSNSEGLSFINKIVIFKW
ncbi:MAG: AbiH family protein [Eubacteriales bacterium]|nr:AbiH family protein [Eubacteriales bacterium]